MDVTEVILRDHEWFRRQFIALFDLVRRVCSRRGGDRRPSGSPSRPGSTCTRRRRRRSSTRSCWPAARTTPRTRRWTRSATTTTSGTGSHDAARHQVASEQWWAAVLATRKANDEHMAEEEREGIADFRQHAAPELRERLGRELEEYLDRHPTTAGVDTDDKDPRAVRRRDRVRACTPTTTAPAERTHRRFARHRQPERTTSMTSPNHLLRDHAPIPDLAWKSIDEEAKERLTPLLAARRLVDWIGPGGWRHDAMSLGRTDPLDGPAGRAGRLRASLAAEAPGAAAGGVPRAVHRVAGRDRRPAARQSRPRAR